MAKAKQESGGVELLTNRLPRSPRAAKRGAVGAFIVAVLLGLFVSGCGEDQEEAADGSGATIPPHLQEKLATIARRTADQLGDPKPEAAVYLVRRQEVLRAIGATDADPANPLVYAIVLEGTFASGRRLPPDDGPAVTGRFSITLCDVDTLRPTNWALRDEWPDRGQFGSPTQLSL